MAKIYSYTKYVDSQISRTLVVPDGSTELATIGDVTYVSIPDIETLPSVQPDEIKASIQLVTMTTSLSDAIKAASPHCKLISDRVIEKIREKYDLDKELSLNRYATGQAIGNYTPTASELQEITDFGIWAEEARQWGRDQRALLGL